MDVFTPSILKIQNCKIKKCLNKSISVHGKNPYCKNHSYDLCCMRNQKNIFNEIRCNATVEMISLDNKMYCNSHFRTLISKCNKRECSVERNNNILSFDKKWYCGKHTPNNGDFIVKMILLFQDKLPKDVIIEICKIHLKSNTYNI